MIQNSRALLRTTAILTATAALLGWLLWPTGTPSPQDAKAATTAAPANVTAPDQAPGQTIKLGDGDTMVAALLRHDIPSDTAYEITAALEAAGANLRSLRPGDSFQLHRDDDARPTMLVHAPSAWLRFKAINRDGRWKVERSTTKPEIRVEMRQGEVKNSLWDAVESGAIAPSALLDLVQIFESEFDFTADTQPGDRFNILIETRYADGVPVDFGRILAAQYVSGEQTLTGIGFATPGGAPERLSYYDAQGNSLKKMFLRSPLEFSRISSGFTYRRPHPVLGGVRPHLAVDYAAPIGTPVWAVADGVVTFAGRSGGNGIQVRVRHRAGYETYYNHLSRLGKGIRRGARVEQKQIIGQVGSTGISTGPHLDYRVKRGDEFVNPLSEKFLPGKKLDAAQLPQFTQQARALLARLEQDNALQLTIDPSWQGKP